MKQFKEHLKEILEGIGIILLMWMITSAGMQELLGSAGVLWGALITGIVILSTYLHNQEENKRYNEKVNMNKKNLQNNNQDWFNQSLRNANEQLRREGKLPLEQKAKDWGDEMRESFNKKLQEGTLPEAY